MNTKCSAVHRRTRSGLTLVELFVIIIILVVLIGMLLPATRGVHEAARRSHCHNNTKQLALAVLNYESTHNQIPAAMGFQGEMAGLTEQGSDRLSGFVALLPYLEQQQLWDQITNPMTAGGYSFEPMGPDPLDASYPPWQEQMEFLQCPSSIQINTGYGTTNYAFCIGDVARGIHNPESVRGAFACRRNTKFSDIADGASNTIAIAEVNHTDSRLVSGQNVLRQSEKILDRPGLCFQTVDKRTKKQYRPKLQLSSLGRGGCWAEGSAGVGLVNTILPPNSPSCSIGGEQESDGIYSVGGSHTSGVNVAMLDGSVRFVFEEIDAGDPDQPTLTMEQLGTFEKPGEFPSPHGVWGELGSANGGEVIDHSDW